MVVVVDQMKQKSLILVNFSADLWKESQYFLNVLYSPYNFVAFNFFSIWMWKESETSEEEVRVLIKWNMEKKEKKQEQVLLSTTTIQGKKDRKKEWK